MAVNRLLLFLNMLGFSLFASCKQAQEENLLSDFVSLNKGLSPNLLFNCFAGIRYAEYDSKKNSYTVCLKYISIFDKNLDNFYTINLYQSGADLATVNNQYNIYVTDAKTKNRKNILSYEDYIYFVNRFHKEYDAIKTPNYYSYNKPVINGNPVLGKFIEFKFKGNKRCYYLKDTVKMTSYWKAKFSGMKQISSNWFIEE